LYASLARAWKRSRPLRTISQRLVEAAEGPYMTCFKDIVPKPYQEFKRCLHQGSFNELPDGINGTMSLNLSQMLSTV